MTWAYRHPLGSGHLIAGSGEEALALVRFAHGYANGIRVFCVQNGEEFVDDYDGVRRIVHDDALQGVASIPVGCVTRH